MNKLTETSNGEKKGKGCQGTFMKDPRTNPKDGEWGGRGEGRGKLETTVFEQHLKKKKKPIFISDWLLDFMNDL